MATIEDQDAAISEAVNGIFVPGTVIADDRLQCLFLLSKLKEFDTKVDYKRWMLSGGRIFDYEKFMAYAMKISGVEPAPIQNIEYNFNIAFDRWRSGLCS